MNIQFTNHKHVTCQTSLLARRIDGEDRTQTCRCSPSTTRGRQPWQAQQEETAAWLIGNSGFVSVKLSTSTSSLSQQVAHPTIDASPSSSRVRASVAYSRSRAATRSCVWLARHKLKHEAAVMQGRSQAAHALGATALSPAGHGKTYGKCRYIER